MYLNPSIDKPILLAKTLFKDVHMDQKRYYMTCSFVLEKKRNVYSLTRKGMLQFPVMGKSLLWIENDKTAVKWDELGNKMTPVILNLQSL